MGEGRGSLHLKMRDTDVSLSFSLSSFHSFFLSPSPSKQLCEVSFFFLMLTSAKFNSLQCFKLRDVNLLAKSSENATRLIESFTFGQCEGTSELSFEEIRCIAPKCEGNTGCLF